jgi:hypothetical protein
MNAKVIGAFVLGAAVVALIMLLAHGKPATVNPPQTTAQEQASATSPGNDAAPGTPGSMSGAQGEPGPSPRPADQTRAERPAAQQAARTQPPDTEKPKEPGQPPAPKEVTVLAGTIIKAALDTTLTSHESHAGDKFTLKVTEPVVVAGFTVIPAGATVQGEVVEAKGSGRISGRGEITLAFKSVTDLNGTAQPIEAETFYGQAKGAGKRDAEMIVGGTGAGAIVGGIVGGKKGAVVGGLIGGAAGTGTVLATKGPEVKLTPGSVFGIHLNASLHLPAGPKAES